MLHIDPGEVEIIPAGVTTCAACMERKASWKMKPASGEESRVPLCGWCVMYGGSEWGRLNAGELVVAGEYVRGVALQSRSLKVIVPVLDERHRLQPDDAERYVLGIVSVSRELVRGSLGKLVQTFETHVDEPGGDGE